MPDAESLQLEAFNQARMPCLEVAALGVVALTIKGAQVAAVTTDALQSCQHNTYDNYYAYGWTVRLTHCN